MKTRRVNVSMVKKFVQCPFRWWCEYVKQRVPIATAPALDAGRVLHHIFERHFRDGEALIDASRAECESFRALIPTAHASAQPNLFKSIEVIEDLQEAFPLWVDKFKADRILAVEEAYEMQDPVMKNVLWIMAPDAEVTKSKYLYHRQNRGLAQSVNFGQYSRLMNRHWHEHLYAEGLTEKWLTSKRLKGYKYGGTHVNLVRKLKFRTNVGKKNEETKSAEEIFYQQTIFISLDDPLHKSVMAALRYHTRRMIRALREWENDGLIPAPNDDENGNYAGNSEDIHFRLLIGEIKIDDPRYFKDREDPYNQRKKAQ